MAADDEDRGRVLNFEAEVGRRASKAYEREAEVARVQIRRQNKAAEASRRELFHQIFRGELALSEVREPIDLRQLSKFFRKYKKYKGWNHQRVCEELLGLPFPPPAILSLQQSEAARQGKLAEWFRSSRSDRMDAWRKCGRPPPKRARDREGRSVPSASSQVALRKISGQLRYIIQGSGLSLTELARRTGVDSGILSRFMRGKRTITLETVDRLSQELGLLLIWR